MIMEQLYFNYMLNIAWNGVEKWRVCKNLKDSKGCLNVLSWYCLRCAEENHVKKHNLACWYPNTLRSESRCVLRKGVGSDVHERLYRPEPV
jgi:hypothetical protein